MSVDVGPTANLTFWEPQNVSRRYKFLYPTHPWGLFSIEISRNGKRRKGSVFESNFEKVSARASDGTRHEL